MSKLTSNLFAKKSWGSEIIWALTDEYAAKTIELPQNSQSPIFVNASKDVCLIVIGGKLVVECGKSFDTLELHELQEGWSWIIPPGMFYRYKSMDKFARFIQISNPDLENTAVYVAPTVPVETKPPRKTRTRKKSKKDA